MSDLSVSSVIKSLSDDCANNLISFNEYRVQRRKILIDLDVTFNLTEYIENDDAVIETNDSKATETEHE